MKVLFSALIIVTFSLFPCGDSNNENIFSLDFSGTYSYSVIISCFCTSDYVGPNAIKIEDGIVTKYNGQDISASDSNYNLVQSLGLDDLILQAEKIIDQNPVRKTIEYHPIYGFISECFFDVDEQIADEEWGYTITDFEVL